MTVAGAIGPAGSTNEHPNMSPFPPGLEPVEDLSPFVVRSHGDRCVECCVGGSDALVSPLVDEQLLECFEVSVDSLAVL